MADPVQGIGYQVGGLSAENDGMGGLCLKMFQNNYNSTGTGEPMLVREVKLTSAQRALLITAISDTE